MSAEEYHGLAAAGCTGVTMYQETYDPVRYEQTHRWGRSATISIVSTPRRAPWPAEYAWSD